MTEELLDKIRNITESIFEITCYMFPLEPLEVEDSQLNSGDSGNEISTSAIVTFHGAANGALLITANPDLFDAIAANMLGVEEAQIDEKEAALCEIANIICGNIVPLFAHNGKICYIDPPSIYRGEDDRNKKLTGYSPSSFPVYLDEGVANIQIYYKQGSSDD